MASVTLYDLHAFGPKTTFSPMTARTKICLGIKGIPYETKWLTFFGVHEVVPKLTGIDTKRPTVPVIEDGFHDGKVVEDSLTIATYLDEAFPDSKPLVNKDALGLLEFFDKFSDEHLLFPIMKLVILRLYNNLPSEEMKEWYRKDRERMFKTTLEKFAGDDAESIAALKAPMKLFNDTLKSSDYLTGAEVGYADVIVAGAFVFLRCGRPELFESALLDAVPDSDLIRKWWDRLEPHTRSASEED
ncbi:hypothetical protein DM01DRAFT_1240638 [Hesseltinella vesiculosa]|uniref:GST N-terminal domain-containing protein n=1 Tax=Hesseltinella vesiculosa TaxID=101127 RepID=A0A1X2GMG1_9FUNG|nr:hypothetical protein DM01DRAFT_1240638 [Hesseltinella vesiculosa]